MKRALQWNTLILSAGPTSSRNLHCSVVCPLKLRESDALGSNPASPDSFRQRSAVKLAALTVVRQFEYLDLVSLADTTIQTTEHIRESGNVSRNALISPCALLSEQRYSSQPRYSAKVKIKPIRKVLRPTKELL